MNERINELIRQSYVTVRSQNDRDVTYFSQEKFAELIVRECATAIINDSRLSDVRSAANGCVRTIKEHFGVKE